MRLLNKFNIINKALLFNKILVISDIHIGFEEALNKQGILVPRFDFNTILKNFDIILSKAGKVKAIVINGDLKHEFGTISDQEWRQTLKLVDYLATKCEKLILVRGNHDTILGPIAKKRNIEIVDYYVVKGKASFKKDNLVSFNKKISLNKSLKNIKKNKEDNKSNVLIIHGDRIPDKELLKNVKAIIIGHEHPAVSIKEWPRAEVFKCFLVGKWKDTDLIVMPSFILFNEGHDITKEENLSPFLSKGFSNFKVYVVADKTYNFGKVNDL